MIYPTKSQNYTFYRAGRPSYHTCIMIFILFDQWYLQNLYRLVPGLILDSRISYMILKPFSCCKFQIILISFIDVGIEFHFSLCDEVDHMIDTEYIKPVEFLDLSNQRIAEQLTYKDAVSIHGLFSIYWYGPTTW